MILSIVNQTNGLISDADLQVAIRAINRQLSEDFDPQWGMTATLRLVGPLPESTLAEAAAHLSTFAGDAIIYLWHPIHVPTALGFHASSHLGVPYGFVFPAIASLLGEPWTVALSHEVLEMVADPDTNLMVMGPHPNDHAKTVFHWYEVCDAVQGESYAVDGVPVSNFVLPLYFTSSEEMGSRNDYLGHSYEGRALPSFSVNPGGYIGYYDPQSGQHQKYYENGDTVAIERLAVKQQLGLARRSVRYEFRTSTNLPITSGLRQFI